MVYTLSKKHRICEVKKRLTKEPKNLEVGIALITANVLCISEKSSKRQSYLQI